MAKTRTMTRNQNYDAISRKRIKTCDKGGVATWSDLTHDVLFFVMMRLGVVDFVAFSGVCKSWRSLALSNKKSFMASRPPMFLSISTDVDEKKCYLEDFEGREFKTILPHSSGRTCVGLTCGYLVLYGEETHDFWLVNPITRHELHFPYAHFKVASFRGKVRAILVFSPSISGWLFAITEKNSREIWFSIAGKGAWNHVSTCCSILDLHAFKGKIYVLDAGFYLTRNLGHLREMRLFPEPKLTLLKTKNFPMRDLMSPPLFVNWGENLYVVQDSLIVTWGEDLHLDVVQDSYKLQEFDFGEMKWVCREKTREEYAFFIDNMDHIVAVKRESWWPGTGTDKIREGSFNEAHMWYFPTNV